MNGLWKTKKNLNRFYKTLRNRIPATTAKSKHYCGVSSHKKRDPETTFKKAFASGIQGLFYVGLLLNAVAFAQIQTPAPAKSEAPAQTTVEAEAAEDIPLSAQLPLDTKPSGPEIVDTSQLTMVPTRAVEPLQVLISSTGEDGSLSGEVLSRRPLHASVLQFILLDKYEGVAWEDNLKLPSAPRRITPFYFETIGSDAPLFLSVQAYDDFGNTVGSGHKIVELKSGTSSVVISNSQAFLDDEFALNFSVFLENGRVRGTYVPQVQIYQGLEHFGELLTTIDQPLLSLEPKQREQLNFAIPFVDPPPGVYEMVVTILDSTTRQPLSASHHQQLYKSGDFFRVIDLSTKYLDEDESRLNLELSGLSTVVLKEPVQMRIQLRYQQNIFLDKMFPLALQPGYFTKNVELQLPAYVSQLSGKAVFYLRDKKLQTVDFSSAPTDMDLGDSGVVASIPETPSVERPGSIVLREGSGLTLTDKQIWYVVAICTTILLLLVGLSWVRQRFLLYLVLAGLGASLGGTNVWALTVGRNVFPMVEWSNPVPEAHRVFNPDSTEGFQWIPVKGRIFNYLTQSALLKGDAFEQTRLNLTSPSQRNYQFKLDQNVLAANTDLYHNPRSGEYYFVLDLARLAQVDSIGRDTTLVWEEGEWQLQLLFNYQQKGQEALWLATPLESFGQFKIDLQPPLWRWQLFDHNGQALSEADFTNQDITINFQCQDALSQCNQTDLSFAVRGNFCADGTRCNTQAVRDFKLCDQAGNCATQSLEITGYDAVAPNIESFLLGSNTKALQANESVPLSLRYFEPKQLEVSASDPDFDQSLCKNDNPHFRLDETGKHCVERASACVLLSGRNVWRGESFDGVCQVQCPEGYRFIDGSCQTLCGEDQFIQGRLCLPFNLQVDEA